ncbi:hypothetical protein IJD44_09785 [bacterium]|nr:hypothetical protein [bacterium]
MKITFNPALNIGKTQAIKNTGLYSFSSLSASSPISDSVSFSGNIEKNKVNVNLDTAKFVANSLSTSTSGHRAEYGSETFNPDVVELLTAGVGEYAKKVAVEKGKSPIVLIGGDTRKATRNSLPLIKDVLSKQGVDVAYIKDPVPTPLLALMAKENDIDIAILLTASHNPWEDGGYNLVTNDGAIAPPKVTKQIADNVVDIAAHGNYKTDKRNVGRVFETNPYGMYKEKIDSYNLINWDKIRNAGVSIYYDGLKGTGDNVFPQLLKDYDIPVSVIDSGKKEGPNPTAENLTELKAAIRDDSAALKIGLANDGDADRFGIVDENGDFITPNDVILLMAHHLANNKGLTGDIIRSQATTSQLDLFAQKNGLKVTQTPVGFKYIAEDIIEGREKEGKDILVAGEESGGLTINGHIPEKDGVIALLMMLDLVATEGKPISQILKEVKDDIGVEFRINSFSKKLNNEEDKNAIMQRMENVYKNALKGKTQFGDFEIDVPKTKACVAAMEEYRKGGDGVKLYFTDGSNVLVRKSGTEPKVKAYIETYSEDAAVTDSNVAKLRETLDKVFDLNAPNVSFKGRPSVNIKETPAALEKVNFNDYAVDGQKAVFDISSRVGEEGQFLNWIGILPQIQLKNLDNLYNMAQEARKGGFEDLAILGIGGSRHTTEAMMKMLGKDSHVHFYSAVDPESFRRFASELDLDKTKFMVVSKSGGTLETTTAYENAKKLVQEYTGSEDVSDRFIAMTDVSSAKSKLRQAVDRGEIKQSGLVHDDVGGRFSIFDDATIFTMAYAGVPKEDIRKMLIASLEAQKEFLNPDINENDALKLAAFNVDAKDNGRDKHYVEYFSDAFSGITLWDKQLNNESLKAKISTETNVGPGYLHYNAEADLDPENTTSFYTFVSPRTDDKTTNAVVKGVTTAYSAQHPVAEIVLDDLSPDSIARFIELKHFETLYTGNLLRRRAGNVTPSDSALPEVLQPNVEKYKKEVKANL